ncbi:Thyrotropin-releasing hormone receptor [Hypsibius exemplaris]|uniref:Thyrotropin-releasing hormone receptor n=1 Tax=Hypsibius exemplaris TaxID=2072580 RepID=A0A1W0WVL1_HYPEX|nr:Thyrotropin-releasing hormone receptor [Hypsibius exemplaris]
MGFVTELPIVVATAEGPSDTSNNRSSELNMTDLLDSGTGGNNDTYYILEEADYPLAYRVVATFLHSLILILGVAGNIVLIAVANRTKSLQTPTYCYLVSLAYADLLVLLSAVPEAIVFHHVGRRWLFGQAVCSLFIFINFLGINAGSISILAFTVERYIAIVRSPLAAKLCTTDRTKKIIVLLWAASVLYCCPWLALTEVKPDEQFPDREQCDFRYSAKVYMGLFAMDFGLFYVVPLAVAVFVYTRITLVLYKSSHMFDPSPCGSICNPPRVTSPCTPKGHSTATTATLLSPNEDLARSIFRRSMRGSNHSRSGIPSPGLMACGNQSRVQVLPMLIVTVLLFALAWLPFRGLLIYNSLVDEPWLDIWYLLLAKTLIYLNSAINPFLYNAMSRRFRVAVRRMLSVNFRIRRRPRTKFSPVFLSTPISSGCHDRHRERYCDPNSLPPVYSSCHLGVRPSASGLSHSCTAQF